MSAPLVMLLAGGTGGHVYPALAVAEELRSRGYRLRWIGTRRGLENRVVPAAHIPLHRLPMRGLRGKGLAQKALAILLLALSVLQSLALLLRHRPRAVVGMGGYPSVPAALAAWVLRRPLLLQEQNAVAGSANRALAPLASCIATGFPGVLATRAAARYLGNPVRRDVLEVAGRHPWQWQGERSLQVLVLGGSLGARPLNEALPVAAATLGARCSWWHQSGIDHLEAARAAYATQAAEASVRVEAFVDDMASAYAWADLVICRAGALTVAELAATGRPSILIPLPHAIDDHQTANARFLADGGAALLLPQSELESGALAPLLASLHDAPERLRGMAASALGLAKPRATQDIADCCEALLS